MTTKYGFPNSAAAAFPPMVIVNTTNVCNFACIHCAHPKIKETPGYRPHYLSWETYTRLADETARYPIHLFRFTGDGETVLNKRIVEMIRYARDRGIRRMDLTTNGSLLDEKLCRGLLTSGLEMIDISIDAFSRERYEQIRRKGPFEDVMANIERLIRLRAELNSPLKIMVSMISQKENSDEVEAFKAAWGDRVDKVLVRIEHENLGDVAKGTGALKESSEPRYPCPQLWNRITVTPEGLLRFCVIDWHDRSVVGNLEHDRIADVWKSSAYEEMRKIHLEGRYAEHPLCGPCKDWVTMRWDYGFDRVVSEVMGDKPESGQ